MDGASTDVVIVDQVAPIEMTTYGNVINGILRVDGSDPIRVRVIDESTGIDTLRAEGHAIIVGQGLTEKSDWAFIRTGM